MAMYDAILKNMVAQIEFRGKCNVEPASDMMLKIMAVANELSLLYDKFDFYEKQLFPSTAVGEYLKKHGESKGIFKKGATKSSGIVAFKSSAPATYAISIPKGTLVGCSGVADVTYQTTTDATLAIGTTATQVSVISVETGAHTAVASGHIDLLITPISGVYSVTNTAKITGGSDGESDESYRQRVVEGYKKISNGCNLNYYEQLAKSIEGVWSAKAVYKTTPTNQIALYVDNNTRTISAEKIAEVQKIINTSRELGINVTVQAPAKKAVAIDVLLEVDNLTNKSAYVISAERVISKYVAELGIGETFSIAQLGALLLAIAGVTDIEFSEPAQSVLIGSGEIAIESGTLVSCI